MQTLTALTRRRLLVGAASIAGAGALEYASLEGTFDHRGALAASASERYRASLDESANAQAGMIHVGHSTHLITLGAARFLTDPWFYDPAFGALSHAKNPAVAPEAIGPLAGLLITHDHADHADLRAIDRLDKSALAVVATGELASRLRGLGFRETHVLEPWESLRVGAVTIDAVPAVHDIYEIGFVLREGAASIYFAGDTALFDGMADIRERLRPTMAILPVDGTHLVGGQRRVMNPEDAVRAARILGVERVVPSHAEAYFSDPLVKYARLASTVEGAAASFAHAIEGSLPNVRCHLPAPGELVLAS